MSTAAERKAERGMVAAPLYKALLEVIAEHDPEKFEAPGDEWLFRSSPDDAGLECDALAAALYRRVCALLGIRSRIDVDTKEPRNDS